MCDVKVGLTRSMALRGWVNDFSENESTFHLKDCLLTFHSPAKQDWLDSPPYSLLEYDACGRVLVLPDLEPELWKGNVVSEPVEVEMFVSNDAFDSFHRQAAEAYGENRIMIATLELSGDPLPNKENLDYIQLKDLDISKIQNYSVTRLELGNTVFFDHYNGRVLEIERKRYKGDGTYLSVLLTESHYQIYTEYVHIGLISCEGHVVNRFDGQPYDGADVSIEFQKFESNEYHQLPKSAFFGEFHYLPRQPDETDSSASFSFDLRYVPEDARDLLIPLLNGENKKQVIFNIRLATEKESLIAATDILKGNILSYDFQVRQHYNNER